MVFNTLPKFEDSRNISDFPYMIGLYSALNAKSLGDEYYSLISQYIKLKTINGSQFIERYIIKQEKCDYSKHFGEYRSYFEMWKTEDHYCHIPNENDLNLVNQFGGNIDYNFIAHYFVKCTNDTSLNKTNCKPQEEIDITLQNVFTSFKFLEYSLDHNNPISAGSIYMKSETNPLSSSLSTRLWFYITNVEYYSDVGFLFEDRKKDSYFYYSKPVYTYNLGECTLAHCFGEIVITLDSKYEKYTKIYSKLQNFLADVGGILKGVLFCAKTISYFFNTKIYNHELITSIFKIDTESKTIEKEDPNQKSDIK
jgi:hypothetical protein